VVRTSFSADFWTFRIFDRNFVKIVAPPSNGNKNYLVRLKWQLMLKKNYKQNQNRPINHDTTPVQNISPRTKNASASERDKQTLTTNSTIGYFRTYSRRCTIFPKLCTVTEHIEIIIKVPNQRIVFPTGCTEKFRLIDRRAVSQQ